MLPNNVIRIPVPTPLPPQTEELPLSQFEAIMTELKGAREDIGDVRERLARVEGWQESAGSSKSAVEKRLDDQEDRIRKLENARAYIMGAGAAAGGLAGWLGQKLLGH